MKKLLMIFFAVALFAGCGGNVRDKIRITEPLEWTVESFSRMKVETTVENDSRHTVRIIGGKFRIHSSSGDFATVVISEEVTIPSHSVTHLSVPLKFKFDNPMAAFGALDGGMLISGEARVRVGAVRKKVRIENESLDKFMSKFDL